MLKFIKDSVNDMYKLIKDNYKTIILTGTFMIVYSHFTNNINKLNNRSFHGVVKNYHYNKFGQRI
jgi:hypothetical protein